MRKFWLADGIQPQIPICPMCNKHEGRFFSQQYLQTFSAVPYLAVPLISNSSSSFCNSWQMVKLVEGVGKRQSEPYGRDQYMKLCTRPSFSLLFLLNRRVFYFLIFYFLLTPSLLNSKGSAKNRNMHNWEARGKRGASLTVYEQINNTSLPFHNSTLPTRVEVVSSWAS